MRTNSDVGGTSQCRQSVTDWSSCSLLSSSKAESCYDFVVFNYKLSHSFTSQKPFRMWAHVAVILTVLPSVLGKLLTYYSTLTGQY